MQDSKQIISIIPNWNYIYYMDGSITIPNERMLIELLRPGCDPESANVQWLAEDEIDKIPDRESQSIARKWSNSRIISMCCHPLSIENPYGIDEISSLIIELCSDNNLDCQIPLYHLAVTRYINRMFPGNLLPNRKNILDHFQTLDRNFRKERWDGFSELAEKAEIEESRYDSKKISLMGRRYIHSSDLEQCFSDYKLANDYLDDFYAHYFYEKGNLVSLFLGDCRDRLINLKQNTKIDIISTRCDCCKEWFNITNFSNGKIKFFCDKDPCKTKYERERKQKKRSGNGEPQNPDKKRGFCEKCGKRRLLIKDRSCKKCLNV